jgi:hypothetical protein
MVRPGSRHLADFISGNAPKAVHCSRGHAANRWLLSLGRPRMRAECFQHKSATSASPLAKVTVGVADEQVNDVTLRL